MESDVKKSIEDIRLDHAAEFPYGSFHEDGEPATLIDWAHWAALGVLTDLCDRGGIKHELRDIENGDPEIAQEIVDALTTIIRRAHERMSPTPPVAGSGAEG